MNARLTIRDLAVHLGGRQILSGVNLTLHAGRLVALLGPNGAGKTTLIKAIAGLLPAKGQVMLEGRELSGIPRKERARLMSYLPQGHQVHWPLNARDVVALGRLPHGLADPARMSENDAAIVARAMERTDTFALADQPVTTLSGGERARVMLARALSVKAGTLLADEPTASLDPRHQIRVMQDLKAEAEAGALVVVVTHDIALASRMADEIVLLDQGRMVAHGAPREVLTDTALAATYGVTALRQEAGGETALLPWGLSQ